MSSASVRPRAMSGSSSGSYQDHIKKGAMSSKNIPCRHWMLKGYCDLKDDCKFGHGDRDGYNGGQFKTKLCRVFLQSGSCPNGFGCNFAHGDGDLRSVWPGSGVRGGAGGVSRFPGDNMKTVMCKNLLELGTCSFGEKCTFAHSEEQIRNGKEQKMIFQNPRFKTTLCKQYTEGEFCELGDNCHFAHGPDELRQLKPVEKPDPSSDPSYKTVLCKNWEDTEGSCEYGESCRFAHGKDELKVMKTTELAAVMEVTRNTSPQYKTVMCSNHQDNQDCKFGSSCNFAHSESELRTVQQNLAEINPNYKGTLCKYFMSSGECQYGSICQYAHGESELRRSGSPSDHHHQHHHPSSKPTNYNNPYLPEVPLPSPQFKTILCKNFEDTGKCDFAFRCQFAHGKLELRTVSQNYLQLGQQIGKKEVGGLRSPPVQTAQKRDLCSLWLQTGNCRRLYCSAAHCLDELTSLQSPSLSPTPQPGPRPVKVVLCQSYSNAGHCDRGNACTFAHGLGELHQYRAQQVPNYRTTLCQAWNSSGHCKYGETCMYAHGPLQLRNKPITDLFSSPSGVPDCKRIKY